MTSESESVLGFFGAELRRARTRAGLTQEQLGDKVGYTGSLISQIETGRRMASQHLAAELDELLGTDGAFGRMWPLVDRLGQGTHEWRNYADREPDATDILTYESSMIPGLLQTEPYARTVVDAVRPTLSADVVQARVANRMTRQEILTRDDPPRLWAILGEAVLHNLVGSRALMADQLRHVLAMAQLPNITIQVLPFAAGVTPAMGVAFLVAEFPRRRARRPAYRHCGHRKGRLRHRRGGAL